MCVCVCIYAVNMGENLSMNLCSDSDPYHLYEPIELLVNVLFLIDLFPFQLLDRVVGSLLK